MSAAFWNGVGVVLQPLLRLADTTGITGKVAPRPAVLPTPHRPHAPTTAPEVDVLLQRLDAAKASWVAVEPARRAELLGQCVKHVMELAPEMARVGTAAKGSYEGGVGDDM